MEKFQTPGSHLDIQQEVHSQLRRLEQLSALGAVLDTCDCAGGDTRVLEQIAHELSAIIQGYDRLLAGCKES